MIFTKVFLSVDNYYLNFLWKVEKPFYILFYHIDTFLIWTFVNCYIFLHVCTNTYVPVIIDVYMHIYTYVCIYALRRKRKTILFLRFLPLDFVSYCTPSISEVNFLVMFISNIVFLQHYSGSGISSTEIIFVN